MAANTDHAGSSRVPHVYLCLVHSTQVTVVLFSSHVVAELQRICAYIHRAAPGGYA